MFVIRLMCHLLDLLIIFMFISFFSIITESNLWEKQRLVFIFAFAYFFVADAFLNGQTIAKLCAKTQVVCENENRNYFDLLLRSLIKVAYSIAFVRALLSILTIVLLFFKRMTLHDWICKTKVKWAR